MNKLDEEQLDALGEVFNIGVGKAAAAMSGLVSDEVLLSVPKVSLMTVAEAGQHLSANKQQLYAVRQSFTGVFRGDAMLIFPSVKSLEIVRIVAGSHLNRQELGALEQDAMGEIGNVMLSACIAALSELLGADFDLGQPGVDEGDGRSILRSRIQNHLVLFLQIRFELKTSAIEGYVVFVLNTTSLEDLRQAINRLLGRPALAP